MSILTIALAIVLPLFQDNPQFPIKLWLPKELKNKFPWVNYGYCCYVLIFLGINTIVSDCAVIGYLIKGCSQLDILMIRIKDFPKILNSKSKSEINRNDDFDIEEFNLHKILKHHQQILRYYTFIMYLLIKIFNIFKV